MKLSVAGGTLLLSRHIGDLMRFAGGSRRSGSLMSILPFGRDIRFVKQTVSLRRWVKLSS
jgi:hypothetical protein